MIRGKIFDSATSPYPRTTTFFEKQGNLGSAKIAANINDALNIVELHRVRPMPLITFWCERMFSTTISIIVAKGLNASNEYEKTHTLGVHGVEQGRIKYKNCTRR